MADSDDGPVTGPELVRKVNTWFFKNDCFHQSLVDFAATYRGHFQDSAQEHSHNAFEVHKVFKQQFEATFEGFLQQHGATMQDLENALSEPLDDICDELTTETVTELMMSLLDYEAFRGLMFKIFIEIDQGAVAGADDPNRHSRWQSADAARALADGTVQPPPARSVYPAVDTIPPVLPDGWAAHIDPATGNTFYQNLSDGSTTWDPPTSVAVGGATTLAYDLPTIQAGLPSGWTAHQDDASGRVFYASALDGSTTWVPPVS